MVDITDEQLEYRMNIISNQIENGCGNPFCEIIHCKSNPSHIEIEEDEKSEYIIMTSIENFEECHYFIKENNFKKCHLLPQ